MSKDDSSKTSKDGPSQQTTSSEDDLWARVMKPSRKKNLTPSQRERLARILRQLRRERWAAARDGS